MTAEPGNGPNGRNDELRRGLRALYAAPDEPAYWEALHAKIMARVLWEREGWWQPFGGWVRAGLIAAGLALVVASAALMHTREEEARLAYEAVIETPRTLPQQLATDKEGVPAREATLRFVISP